MKTYFWETSPFFRLLLPFAAGIFCYDVLAIESPFSFYVSMGIALCCITISWVKNSHFIKAMSFFMAFTCLGFSVSFKADIKNDPCWFGNKLKTAGAFSVKITEAPQEKERTWKLVVDVEEAVLNDSVERVKGKAFVYIYKNDSALDCKTGDILLVPSSWQPLKNPGNPYEFDYATFCKRNNIYYQQFLGKSDIIKISEGDAHSLSLAGQTHEWAMDKLALYVKDKSTLGLLQAMLLGDEVNFSDEDRQLYVDTGIIHVVAISGGHIGFLMLLINGCLFWIRRRNYQWIKLIVALPIVVFYVMVAGAPPSAVRAAFVFGLSAMSTFIRRDNNSLNSLLAAAFGILLIKPMWLFAVGFQLSFVAVLSLIIFYKRIYRLYYPPTIPVKFLWSATVVGIAAEILVAPLVIYYFHLFPALFLVANVIAVLLMGIVMTLGLLIVAVSSFPIAANMFAWVVSFIVGWFHKVIHYIRLSNPDAFKYLHLSLMELLLCYFCIAGITTFSLQKSKPALYTSLVGFCLLLLSFNIKQWKALHQEQIVIYNVSRYAYAEHISGNLFQIISESEEHILQKKIDYAVRENHVTKRAWRENKELRQQDILFFNNRKIAFLKAPLISDSVKFQPQPIDFLILEYPVNEFNVLQLLNMFEFGKLIITGNQRRKSVQVWKDSCDKHHIDVHVTMLDGAYVLDGSEQ